MRELNVTLLYETTLALTHFAPLHTWVLHLGPSSWTNSFVGGLCGTTPQPWLDVPPMSGPGVVRTHEACLYTELELINCTMSCLPLHVQKTCTDFCSVIIGEYYHQLQIRDCFRKLRESCGKGEARTSTQKKGKKAYICGFPGSFLPGNSRKASLLPHKARTSSAKPSHQI